MKKNYAPWLNDETKAMIKKRDEAHKTALSSKKPEDHRLFKNLRNATTKALRKAKEEWESKQVDEVCNSLLSSLF